MTILSAGASNFKLQGLSTDEKPMDVQNGATLHIVDTGAQYVFHDGGWVEDLRQIYALNHV